MPTPLAADALLANLAWRYATKQFDPARKIDAGTWTKIEEAMTLAPSSYGLQPWKFVVLSSNADLRARLRAVSWNQPQITDASHMVVFAQKQNVAKEDVERHIQRVHQVRGGDASALAGYRDMMVNSMANPAGLQGGTMLAYTRAQTYIALGFGLYTAAQLNIDACPMEGFDANKYDEILGLTPLGYHAAVVATFGYRSPNDAMAKLAKVRFEPKDVILRM